MRPYSFLRMERKKYIDRCSIAHIDAILDEEAKLG